MHFFVPVVAVSVALIVASEARSQAAASEPDAAAVAALLRKEGHAGGALAVLTQARGPRPPQQMDEIADSLAAIAVSFPGNDARGASTRAAAEGALLGAGLGETGIVGRGRAIPYTGAADRLMRLAETAQDVGIRATALWDLTLLPNNPGVLPFLRKVATSQNAVAYKALTLLANDTGAAGHAIARELYRGGQVTEPFAKEVLTRVASEYGWE